jgi:hypothetical protein
MRKISKSAFIQCVTVQTQKALEVFVDNYPKVFFRSTKCDKEIFNFELYGLCEGKFDVMAVRSRGRLQEKFDMVLYSSVNNLPTDKKKYGDRYNMFNQIKEVGK